MSAVLRAATALLATGTALPVQAQLTAPTKNGDMTIVVTGNRPEKAGPKEKMEMSDWRMAETPHVVVFAKGAENERKLVQTAHNLEKLHFLLSMLLNRVDQPDDTIKIALTMIGDEADFEQLRLTNTRWQYEPYPNAFPRKIYFDPREEGSVLATTQTPLKIMLQEGVSAAQLPPEAALSQLETWQTDAAIDECAPGAGGRPWNEVSVRVRPEQRLYSTFAQNYLLTYFPAAYPRWYVQGFGELFGTLDARANDVEYGTRPACLREVMDRFGQYPVSDVLSGRYLNDSRLRPEWTPYHAWRLVHLLFFSKEWKGPLNRYLRAVATGAEPRQAMRELGDLRALQKAVTAYQGRKVPFERMTFPAERAPAPIVRQLTRAEAGLIRGRLELGARIDVPAPPAPGTDARTAARINQKREIALARRQAWLGRLRDNAKRFPALVENQLLLAEAECRSSNSQACLAAAERALAIGPTDTTALVWKGTALSQLAAAGPINERAGRLKQARALIVQANKADPNALLPMIAYHRSFTGSGEAPSDAAVDAMFKVVESVPAAPKPRVQLASDLVRRDLDAEARRVLLPVAKGAYDTPERPEAESLLKQATGVQRP